MTTKNVKILLKKSSQTGHKPVVDKTQTNGLDFGELAINYADEKLFYKKDETTINTVPLHNFKHDSNGFVPAPGGNGTSKYLREDGTWVTPPNDNTDTKTTYDGHYTPTSTGNGSTSTTTEGSAVSWSNSVVTGITRDGKGHITSVTTGTIPSNPNTDTKVTSAANHYEPTAVETSKLSKSASGATAAWGIDVVKGITIERDDKGHITNLTITSGKTPDKPDAATIGAIGTITAASGTNINTVGTPTVSASTTGTATTLTFNYLKGSKGDNGTSAAWFTGTAVTGTAASITATVTNSKAGDMYLNNNTYNVYSATAANTWKYVCNIQGATGSGGGTGTRGSRWTTGTTITGTATTNTQFINSGITDALVNDMYLNTSTYNIYKCTVAGNATNARWVYTGNIKGTNGSDATVPTNVWKAGVEVVSRNTSCTLSSDYDEYTWISMGDYTLTSGANYKVDGKSSVEGTCELNIIRCGSYTYSRAVDNN